MTADQLDALRWRRRYLDCRIEVKKKAGLDTIHDERERDALDAALKVITERAFQKPVVISAPPGQTFSEEVRQATKDRMERLEADGRGGMGRITFPHLAHGTTGE